MVVDCMTNGLGICYNFLKATSEVRKGIRDVGII